MIIKMIVTNCIVAWICGTVSAFIAVYEMLNNMDAVLSIISMTIFYGLTLIAVVMITITKE